MTKRGRPPKYPWTTLPVEGAFLVDKNIPPDHVRSIASRAGKKYGRHFTCTQTEHGMIVTRVDERDVIPFSTPDSAEDRQWRAAADTYRAERLADQLIRRHGADRARLIAAAVLDKVQTPTVSATGGLGPPLRRHVVIPLEPENLDRITPTHEPAVPLPRIAQPAEPVKALSTVMAGPIPPKRTPEPVPEPEWFPTSAG